MDLRACEDRVFQGTPPIMKPPEERAAWLEGAPRFLFFTGKGGVGKTSLACASAVALADTGQRVLLVGTDPASNLDELLAVKLGGAPTAIPNCERLDALNINPVEAAQAYREKIISPMRGLLPETALRSMEEQLSGACTMEIAAFDEFSRLLGERASTAGYDHVVFDTAPTGHTLRLLALPKAWTGFFAANTSGATCLGPLAGLEKQRHIYEAALASLADAASTLVVIVSRAQSASLREAARAHGELDALGIRRQVLILNGLFQPASPGDAVADAFFARQEKALLRAVRFLSILPVHRVALRPHNLLGIETLRGLLGSTQSTPPPRVQPTSIGPIGEFSAPIPLLEKIASAGRGLILTMGKGGVGKTTIAAAVALWLSEKGHRVTLSTTDPASHLSDALEGNRGALTVSRIDPAFETAAYVEQVLAEQSGKLDAESHALLEEDLKSPCTEEIAVFRAFARTVAEAQEGFVVLDTAPTGHTLLLLDASLAYHTEINRKTHSAPEEVSQLLSRLRDPNFTHVLIVTLPEATPVHEAAALQEDLRRAGIEPTAWIVNQSFHRLPLHDPLLAERACRELPYLKEVLHLAQGSACLIDWQISEPIGAEALLKIFSPT